MYLLHLCIYNIYLEYSYFAYIYFIPKFPKRKGDADKFKTYVGLESRSEGLICFPKPGGFGLVVPLFEGGENRLALPSKLHG